jgi:ABC-type glycerol-3-phosphate transport system permease component
MAASVTAMAPMIAAFLLGQRYFIEGIKLGAVKG